MKQIPLIVYINPTQYTYAILLGESLNFCSDLPYLLSKIDDEDLVGTFLRMKELTAKCREDS